MIKKLLIITGVLFSIILSLGFISSQCFYDEWECNDGYCIPDDWRCDGTEDCAGGEDESGCDTPPPCTDTCSSLGYCEEWGWVCGDYVYCSNACPCTVTDDCASKACRYGDVWCKDNCGDWDHEHDPCTSSETCCGTTCETIDDCATISCYDSNSFYCYDECGDYSGSYDCASSTPHCASTLGRCVECEVDPHCDPGEVCYNNACCTPDCDDSIWPCGTPWTGSDYCGGTCSGTGTWCPSGQDCVGGICVAPCTEGSHRCDGDSYQTCTSGAWVTTDTCDDVRYQNQGCQKDEDYCNSASGCLWENSWTNVADGTVCSSTDFCSGDGYYTGKKCSSGTCSDSYGYTACPDASCSSDGDGTYSALSDSTCNPATTTCTTQSSTDCGYYACSGTSCATSCTSDADCASAYLCEGGTCDLCTLSSASWSVPSAREGDTVTLTAIGSHCAGKLITYKIYDEGNNLIDTLTDTYSSTDWVVEWLAGGSSPYYFKALFDGEEATSGDLVVTACGDGVINGGEVCDSSDLGSCVQCDMDTINDPETCVCAEYCGDSIVQTPNDDGQYEECDGVPGCTNCMWFPEAFWADSQGNEISTKAVVVGVTGIDMILRYTGFASGTSVDFEIWEYDLLGSDYIRTINDTIDSAGAVTAVWIPTQEDMDKTSDYNKFFFIVKDSSENEIAQSGDLDIRFVDPEVCLEINFCVDYDEEMCETGFCNVSEISVENINPDITCGEGYICWCEWIEGECGPGWEVEKYCGNNEIDSGETCDGTDWGLITGCDNSGGTGLDAYIGGTLSCKIDCTFDVSQCTGGVTGGYCGDDIIQSPNNDGFYETCDNDSLSEKTCADFGLCEDGGLACYPPEHTNNCTFNTIGCVACESHPRTGNCNYKESTDDDCDDKFLTYSWEGIWTWDLENIFDANPDGDYYILGDDGKWHYDPNRASEKCVDGSTTVPCPAQIKLPFFGPYSVIAILVLIVLIYIFLTQKKKGKKLKFFK